MLLRLVCCKICKDSGN